MSKKNNNTGTGKKTTGILCGISYGTLIAVWYCPVVMGKKTTGMGKKPQEWAKNHRNSLWISYGTLIAVWYCPMVINGQKTTGMGKKKTTGIVCGFPIVH